MSVMIIGLIVVGLVVVVIGSYIVTIYNGLISVKNDVDKAWANIDVLLKQRHDELPKLISTCEAYMKYEKDTLAKVVELRNSAHAATTNAERVQKESQLTTAITGLLALSENYPDLKAQANFQNLQSRISGLENQIADRREFYNESVNNFNIRIQSIPDNILAGFMSLTAREMFKVNPEDTKDVDVKINVPS